MSFGGYENDGFFYFYCDRRQCNWPHWCAPRKCCEREMTSEKKKNLENTEKFIVVVDCAG